MHKVLVNCLADSACPGKSVSRLSDWLNLTVTVLMGLQILKLNKQTFTQWLDTYPLPHSDTYPLPHSDLILTHCHTVIWYLPIATQWFDTYPLPQVRQHAVMSSADRWALTFPLLWIQVLSDPASTIPNACRSSLSFSIWNLSFNPCHAE